MRSKYADARTVILDIPFKHHFIHIVQRRQNTLYSIYHMWLKETRESAKNFNIAFFKNVFLIPLGYSLGLENQMT
jgi:hypothetical protein